MLTPRKGLVLTEIEMPDGTDRQSTTAVDVLSVHFDYLSNRAKRRQVDELVSILAERGNPTIVLGDFNSGWNGPNSHMRDLVAATGLIAYQPESEKLATHEGTRIDWILISREFRFQRYQVLPQIVSDHLPVIADIGFSNASPLRPECQIGP
jgi:endonuclease/exonuclease/phosphatase family metal-dependent hydrolase